MKQGQYIEEDKLLKQGIDILMEQLVPIETSRFLSFPIHKRMEVLPELGCGFSLAYFRIQV